MRPTSRGRIVLGTTLLALLVLSPAVAHAAPSDFDALRSKGWLLTFLGVFASGILTSLTPCVYPMITITVGIFGARESKSRLRAFGVAIMYVLGMVAMYATLGVISALTGRMSGSGYLLANPWVVVPIVLLYGALAASMFGAFELNLPPSVQAKLSGVGGKGTFGAFLMGLVGGLTAVPCTGPMLAGLLIFIGTTRNVLLGAGLMTTFGLGMGVLFIVIATFALRLPKSGAWMEIVKALGGIALVGVAVYFLRPIVPPLRHLATTSTLYIAVGAGVVIAGLALLAHYMRAMRKGPALRYKIGGLTTAIVGVIMVMSWLLLPKHPLPWRRDGEVALADARQAGKPVLVDFSATWCHPCEAFEADVLSDSMVYSEVTSRFVPVKYDVSKGNPGDRSAQARWEAATLPTVILLDAEGHEVQRYNGHLPSAGDFLKAIRAVE